MPFAVLHCSLSVKTAFYIIQCGLEDQNMMLDFIKNAIPDIAEMREDEKKINQISACMCTAKWLQSTVLLHTGETHSCHHVKRHDVPLSEIKKNPFALHNTEQKKREREKMLKGERPEECDYCWNIEDLKKGHISERIYKSTNPHWSLPFLDKVISSGSEKNIDPSYLEIAFNNICNFKCAYCDPTSSSSWVKEIQTYGSYPMPDKAHDIKENVGQFGDDAEDNPYIDAFWKWWPHLYENLTFFRITGGEPLLSKHTWKILNIIGENPRKEFNFAINSNMGVSEHSIGRFIEQVNRIAPNIKSFDLYTSCESYGKQAEYTRYGINYEQFIKNNYYFLKNTFDDVQLHFMITFNILSFSTFTDFLLEIKKMRKKYVSKKNYARVYFHIQYLRHPLFLSARIALQSVKERYRKEFIDFANEQSLANNQEGFLYGTEVDQIKRLTDFISTSVSEDQLKCDRDNFRKFIDEYDRRRKTSFKETFPEALV